MWVHALSVGTLAESPPETRDVGPDLVAVSAIREILQGYAQRGFFRGAADGVTRGQRITFKVLWHYGRVYPLVVDFAARSISFPRMLPGVQAGSPMVKNLRDFLRPFATGEVPEHRRLDPQRGRMSLVTQKGALTFRIRVRDGDYEYCARKLVHLTHEIFMIFLREGPYYEYRVEQLGLDPDREWA